MAASVLREALFEFKNLDVVLLRVRVVKDSTLSGWSTWSVRGWNDALVNSVFIKRPDLPSEIVRVDATSRLLVAAANGNPTDADEIRQAFLSSFPTSRPAFSRLFDIAAQTRHWRPTDPELPFFAQLYLTVLVTTASARTRAVGKSAYLRTRGTFRRRVVFGRSTPKQRWLARCSAGSI
jgi:hypothetical protein